MCAADSLCDSGSERLRLNEVAVELRAVWRVRMAITDLAAVVS